MSKGEKKWGSPRQPSNFIFQGQSHLQIARLDVAPVNLKRAIKFYKFKKKKGLYADC
jgi:hypothetical protein